jgi:hypothetical protein
MRQLLKLLRQVRHLVQTRFQAYDASGNTVGPALTGGQTATKKLQFPPAESSGTE